MLSARAAAAAAVRVVLTVAFVFVPSAEVSAAAPTVFWLPDQAGPGDMILAYGGQLADAQAVLVWRLADGNPALAGDNVLTAAAKSAVRVRPLQATDHSLKFALPGNLKPGVFAVQVVAGKERSSVCLLNRPQMWFVQPTTLRPGLAVNQAPPGAEIQLIGKNFTVRGDSSPRPRLSLRPRAGGAAVSVPLVKAEPFSLTAQLPEDIAAGQYELFAHNGKGGPVAWGKPLHVEIKKPDVWPARRFNVRDFGARGDDVTDDTRAIRDALAAADKNGGGVVYFPWGTYRLSDWICVPERTVLRGQLRDATILKWPLDVPKDEKDFQTAAVFVGPRCGLENLTLVARRVKAILLDVQNEFNAPRSVPPEVTSRIRPWGQGGDVFLRKVLFQHLLLAGRPEQQKQVVDNPALNKRYWEGLRNALIHDGRNVEVSDCSFEGGDQQFTNLVNARVVRNHFANHMGYSWTALGGGAIDVVCQGNKIQASSSWGWGWTGMQRVYSAHNTTHNFVRGEREAMTLDVSALPTARPAAGYWGTPVEVRGGADKPFLRFPAASQTSPDGFKTGWVPGCFQGGTVFVRAYQGGPGTGQSRTIVDNTADTVYLDKPFATPPATTPRKMYVEVAPRHHRAHIGTTAWLGRLGKSEASGFTAKEAQWVAQEFVGMTALVLDGKGAGQYRVITSNTTDGATLDRPWDVVPDGSSVVGIWSLMRHMVVYDCRCTDASAFAQMYGSFYDYTVDGCRVDRTQGLWGQMGWFVQFRNNQVSYAHSYHRGIGMRGPNPEKNAPFGYSGLDSHRLRITKSGSLQYPTRKLPVFADEVLGKLIPTTLGHVQRGNTLRFGQRVVVQPWTGPSPPGPRPGGDLFRDVVLDANAIEHSAVGIQLGPNVGGAVLSRNVFRHVARPLWLARPKNALDLGPGNDGEKLFAGGDLSGWVEEQHDFFKKKHPDVGTWKVKDGIVCCDGSFGNCGFLRYEKKLDDFTLRLEYRMSKGCNSGVCVRVPKPYNGVPDETLPSKTGYEVQIQDDADNGPSLTSSGALYGAVAPEVNAAKPAGEWNSLEIVCQGPRIRVTLNDVVVQDVDQTTVGAIRERRRSGYLLLQNHGHDTEFRNVWLKLRSGAADKKPGR